MAASARGSTARCPEHVARGAPLAPLLRPRGRRRAAAVRVAGAGAPVVLVQDGQLVASPPASPQELLAQQRAWSYTTALAPGGDGCRVVDWPLHLRRLARNVELLGEQRPPAYAPFLAWLREQPPGTSAAGAIDRLVRGQVAAALRQLAAQPPEQGLAEEARAMVAVVLTDPQPPQPPQSPPLSVLVWAKRLPPAGAAPRPARVLVAGAPRPLAGAKHCDWVVARAPLEAAKAQAGADEVLLADGRGALLEGLVNNWFVVADAAALGAQDSQPGAARAGGGVAGLVLLTAAEGDAALPGVAQQRVLQAAAAVGLAVERRPPLAAEAHAWREAFLTNAVRGIQPVGHVQLAPGRAWEPPPGSGAVTALLQRALAEAQEVADLGDA
ncbi:hypothetical protein HT031_001004 [Scenedesmus sp. PABB004]|nr:hypothetical protein HT031_001004 [Scenedesmus sp. PABB004]